MHQVEDLPRRKSLSHSQLQAYKDKQKQDKQSSSIHTGWNVQFNDDKMKHYNQHKEDFILNKQIDRSRQEQNNSYVKVKEINQYSREYSVLVKVLRSIQFKSFHTNMNYVKVVIADQTACANGFFKGENCQFFKVGNVLAIKKGVVRIIKGHIQLQLSDFGRIIEKNSNLAENTQLNISSAQIQRKRYKSRYNESKTDYSNRKSSQYKNYNKPYGKQMQRGEYDNKYRKQRVQRYYNGEQYTYKRDSKPFYYNNDNQNRRYYHEQNYKDNHYKQYKDRQEKQYRNRQERQSSKESISFFIKKRSFSREKSLTSSARKNQYFKINQISQNIQSISVVGRVKKIFKRYNSNLIFLQDQTGQIKAYLPPHDQLTKGNIIVIHNLKCRFDRSNNMVLVPKGKAIISKAKQNLKPILSLNP